jgi:hypothetical protein
MDLASSEHRKTMDRPRGANSLDALVVNPILACFEVA